MGKDTRSLVVKKGRIWRHFARECQSRPMSTMDGTWRTLETHTSVGADHCNVWTSDFPNISSAAQFLDDLLNDRIVDSPV